MVSPRIFKTKFYLCRKVEKGYQVLHEIGPFDTESKAHLYMCQEVTPGSRLMERKPEFAGVMTQRGARILSRPKVYNLPTEEQASLTPPDVARWKARYGRRDWIVYKGKDGDVVGELAGRNSIKRALLAIGTQGYFILYHGGGGSSIVTWSIGVNMWRNARYLYPQEQSHANAG